jgi:hypothetical protein
MGGGVGVLGFSETTVEYSSMDEGVEGVDTTTANHQAVHRVLLIALRPSSSAAAFQVLCNPLAQKAIA